jgi:hypothetical protein
VVSQNRPFLNNKCLLNNDDLKKKAICKRLKVGGYTTIIDFTLMLPYYFSRKLFFAVDRWGDSLRRIYAGYHLLIRNILPPTEAIL